MWISVRLERDSMPVIRTDHLISLTWSERLQNPKDLESLSLEPTLCEVHLIYLAPGVRFGKYHYVAAPL